MIHILNHYMDNQQFGEEPTLQMLASSILKIGLTAPNEEKVKIEIEKLLGIFGQSYGITIDPQYEFTFTSGREADALYSHVIIEYEPPGSLDKKKHREHAIKQVESYIEDSATLKENLHKYFGIVLDGRQIVFVRYSSLNKRWEPSRNFDINPERIATMVEALRSLNKKALDANLLILDFGPKSEIARKTINILYSTPFKNSRSRMLYADWERVFEQVSAYEPKKAKGLEKFYDITASPINYKKLIFCIHTYYALIMKIIAAEVVVLYGGGKFTSSYLESLLESAADGNLKVRLDEVEDGSIYQNAKNIKNFLEGDYFSWYLDEWNNEIQDTMISIVRQLSRYDVGTADLEPERVRDLFKNLYQKLIPRTIRIKLGEFYTPDWLGEHVLDSSGFNIRGFEEYSVRMQDQMAPLDLRFLDPACGSGTFLVLAIKQLKEYGNTHFINPGTLVDKITENIVGYDLNPLAVIASRTNYLLALGDLVRFLKSSEIPVFLTDSIMIRERPPLFGRKMYSLDTAVGNFSIPASIIEKGLLRRLLSAIADYVVKQYTREQFIQRLNKDIPEITEEFLDDIGGLYDMFCELERSGKNRIWTGILKNSFAPFYMSKFDYIIGNPPWVSWDNLPKKYRDGMDRVWDDVWSAYTKVKGQISGSSFKKDISALFVAVCHTRYLSDRGTLAFLVPYTLFKSQASSGFRRYLANNTKIETIHDLVSLRPFEGAATNRTAMLVLSKGTTKFPIRIKLWKRKEGANIHFSSNIEQVKRDTQRFSLLMEPIDQSKLPEKSWFILIDGVQQALRKAIGKSYYEAQEGINTRGANGIFFLRVLDKQNREYYIENMHEEQRINEDSGKKIVKSIRKWIEPTLVYPLLRGHDIKRWKTEPSAYILVPSDPKKGTTYSETEMKVDFPKAYEFLLEFKAPYLENRSHYGRPIKGNFPYYELFQVNSNCFTKYKAVWKEISGEISGKGDLVAAAVKAKTKPHIVDHKAMMVSLQTEDELYYVTGILNSSVARLVVASYIIETAISTHLLDHLLIPQFDKNNKIHKSIVQKSKDIHDDPSKEKLVNKWEDELNHYVAKLYSITSVELRTIEKLLKVLI